MSSLSEHEVRFAANVARVRAARKMTQEELARLVGMGRSAIVAVERGGRRIRLGEACAIAVALNVPLGELVSDQPLTIQITVD